MRLKTQSWKLCAYLKLKIGDLKKSRIYLHTIIMGKISPYLYFEVDNVSKSWKGLIFWGTMRPDSKDPLYVSQTTFPISKVIKITTFKVKKWFVRVEKLLIPRFACKDMERILAMFCTILVLWSRNFKAKEMEIETVIDENMMSAHVQEWNGRLNTSKSIPS